MWMPTTIQGEYSGSVTFSDGYCRTVGLQVVTLGDGKFDALWYQGGLPGNGYDGSTRRKFSGHRTSETNVELTGDGLKIELSAGSARRVKNSSGGVLGWLQPMLRYSLTEGAARAFECHRGVRRKEHRSVEERKSYQRRTAAGRSRNEGSGQELHAARGVSNALQALRPRPGSREQRVLSAEAVRSAGAGFLRVGTAEQRLAHLLYKFKALDLNHVLSAAKLADL